MLSLFLRYTNPHTEMMNKGVVIPPVYDEPYLVPPGSFFRIHTGKIVIVIDPVFILVYHSRALANTLKRSCINGFHFPFLVKNTFVALYQTVGGKEIRVGFFAWNYQGIHINSFYNLSVKNT